jgi:HAD superfamily hydrolase (TIGR01549 family)
MTGWPLEVDTVVLDIDGTLVDSNYHHTLAWWHAFRQLGHEVPAWRIHRAIGMGGDRLVAEVAGRDVEREAGDAVRTAWEREYDRMVEEVPAFDGAPALLAALRARGFRVALASSGIPRHTAHAVEVLHADEHSDTWTTSEDSESSKPDPELLEVALERVHGTHAVVVGDSIWDVEAARGAGLPALCLLSGGSGRAELLDAGAAEVCSDPRELTTRLDDLLRPRSVPAR